MHAPNFTGATLPSAVSAPYRRSGLDWWPVSSSTSRAEAAAAADSAAGLLRLPAVLEVASMADLPAVAQRCRALQEALCEEANAFATLRVAHTDGSVLDHVSDLHLAPIASRFRKAVSRARALRDASVGSIRLHVVNLAPTEKRRVERIIDWANDAMSLLTQSFLDHVEELPPRIAAARHRALSGGPTWVNLGAYTQPWTPGDVLTTFVERVICMATAAGQESAPHAEVGVSSRRPPPVDASSKRRPPAKAGKVYALANASMPGLVKIGKTRGSVEERAAQLGSTGVPTPFVVLHQLEVEDCGEAERMVHTALAKHRISDRREFFAIDSAHAIAALRALSGGDGKCD